MKTESDEGWYRLTASGSSAIQIFALQYPSAKTRQRLLDCFSPRGSGRGSLNYGWLHDREGELLDEILLEESPTGFLLHLHGGAVTAVRLEELLTSWGVQPRRTPPVVTLEEEIIQVLAQAPTTQAAQVAAGLFATLPQAKDPRLLLGSWDYARSLFFPTRILLAGAPNAGKSSLLNRLLGQERAVVSATAGTTRDLVTGMSEIDGRLIAWIDGAGLRDDGDDLERAGQTLVREQADAAAVLWVVNPLDPPAPCPLASPIAVVLTHTDQPGGHRQGDSLGGLPVIKTGLGDQGEPVKEFVARWLPPPVEGPLIFTARQKALVEKALETGIWNGL